MEPGQTAAGQQFRHHLDYFGVNEGGFRTNRFGANLEKLAKATLLRTFPAEHRSHVVKLEQPRLLVEAMFNIGADHRCRVLRTQCEGRPVAVFKRVHLLGNDIGFRAYTAGEKLGFLEDGRADFLVMIRPEYFAGSTFHAVPHRRIRRQ